MSTHIQEVHGYQITKVPTAKKGRDQLDIKIYGMEGVPAEVIEERINYKKAKKLKAIEKWLKEQGVEIDAPAFSIKEYEPVNPFPLKKTPQLLPPQPYLQPPPVAPSYK